MSKKTIHLGLLALFVLTVIWACDSANPVAPNGATLSVSANPTQIGLSGSSVLTVTGFKPDGNRLNPGTQIQFSTSIGILSAAVVSVDNEGRAIAVLSGTGQQGTATVTVTTSGSDSETTIDVLIGEDDTTRPVLTITANPSDLGFEELSDIVVQVTNADGSSGGSGNVVSFRSTLGTIAAINGGRTNGSGLARATLTAETIPGTATVTATMPPAVDVETAVTIADRMVDLTVTANPDSVVAGEGEDSQSIITILARDGNGQPLPNLTAQVFTNLGAVASPVVTGEDGIAISAFTAGNISGSASIAVIAGSGESAPVTIEIRDVIGQLFVTADESRIDVEDTTFTVRAQALDTAGRALNGVIVTFETDPRIGNLTPFSDVTAGEGIAESTFTVTQAEVQSFGPDAFDIIGTATSEGATRTGRVRVVIVRGAQP